MKKEVVGGATGHFEGCSCVAPWRKCVGHTRRAIENQEVLLQRYWSMEHKRNVIGRASFGSLLHVLSSDR